MEIARGYKERGLPISVIVVDYFHWPYQGDWKFDTDFWPDAEKMGRELKEMGYLTRTEMGTRMAQLGDMCFADLTNPEARAYIWEKIKKNYYDKGIKIFWLDEAEPEFTKYEFQLYRYHRGPDLEVGNLYPRVYAQMAYEGMAATGQQSILNLIRCAWAGSQRYGALVWSGDIDSSFRSLRSQLEAGLKYSSFAITFASRLFALL